MFGLVLVTIVTSMLLKFIEKLLTNHSEYLRHSTKLMDRLSDAIDKLESWENEKPYLYHGACPYARTLIISQLEIMTELELRGYPEYSNPEYRQILYDLLDNKPPPDDPSHCDGFYFIFVQSF